MRCNLEIKNYRCFEDRNPVRLEIRPGFKAFVGPNNSGKTTLLRFFYENRDLWNSLANTGPISQALASGANSNPLGISDVSEIFCRKNTRDISISIEILDSVTPHSIERFEIFRQRDQNNYKIKITLKNGMEYRSNTNLSVSGGYDGENQPFIAVRGSPNIRIDCVEFVKVMQALGQCVYIGPFRNAINQGAGPYYDIPVGNDFINTWDSWKHGENLSQKKIIQKVIADIKNIFRFESLEIEANSGRNRLDFIVNGEPYKDSELGAGLSEFVITLGCAATRPTSFLLIDEPEIHLHPSLQADYLTSLGAYTQYGVMFATHSIGLARTIAEEVFSCHAVDGATDVKQLNATVRLSEFLGEMSFSSYSELGFKKILLVEGPTDFRVIQQWLRLKRKDHEILMLSLGGDSLATKERAIEIAEIRRIHPEVYALVDSEKDSEQGAPSESRVAFAKQCKDLKIPAHLTERRALDNYLTDRAVKAALGPSFSALGPYEKLKEAQNGWAKSQNWRIAREMKWDDIQGTDIGRFLETVIG